jgi:CubicO group peptidase (beta-lactamase class C family)
MDGTRLTRITEHFNRAYLEPGKIAGGQVLVARHGEVAHFENFGSRDLERGKPVEEDTIWRIYSMTKPITGVALMSLYERGLFQLSDPIHRFIPEWRDLKVQETADDGSTRLVEPHRPMSVRDVLMHMSGFSYESLAAARQAPVEGEAGRATTSAMDGQLTLETMVGPLAQQPLQFHPGEHWLYGISTDICGRLVEILSGQRFDEYLQDALFDPLGMVDTGFRVPDDKVDRFAANYRRNSQKKLVLLEDPETSAYRRQRAFLSGGGGLVSTMPDYYRFCQMLVNGGELDGTRILGPKTVEVMASNHLPGGGQLRDYALASSYGEVGFDGMGFGLTMAVSQGPVATQVIGSTGEYMWGGAASTIFWIDPAEQLVVIFMTQLMPSRTFNFRSQLKTLVYPAIVE